MESEMCKEEPLHNVRKNTAICGIYTWSSVSVRKIHICAVCYRSYPRKTRLRSHVLTQKHFALGNRIRKLKKENLQIELPYEWKYGNYHFNTVSSILQVIIYDLHSKEQILEWMATFMETNKSKFVIYQSGLTKGKQYYVRYRCEHYNDPARKTTRKKKVKGTGCKCAIYFTLKRNLAEVRISNLTHNHLLTSEIGSKEISKDYFEPLNYDPSEQIEQDQPMPDVPSYSRMENKIIQPDIHKIDSASKDHSNSGMAPEEMEILLAKFKEFKKKWDDIFQIMNRNYLPEYSKGLESMNKHLDTMINMPSKILPSLFLFNMNAGFLAKKNIRSTKQIGVNTAAVS